MIVRQPGCESNTTARSRYTNKYQITGWNISQMPSTTFTRVNCGKKCVSLRLKSVQLWKFSTGFWRASYYIFNGKVISLEYLLFPLLFFNTEVSIIHIRVCMCRHRLQKIFAKNDKTYKETRPFPVQFVPNR